jgi:hypothetical protein
LGAAFICSEFVNQITGIVFINVWKKEQHKLLEIRTGAPKKRFFAVFGGIGG